MKNFRLLLLLFLVFVAGDASGGGWSLNPNRPTPRPRVMAAAPPIAREPAAIPPERYEPAAAEPEPAPPEPRIPQIKIPTEYRSALGILILKADVNYPEMLDGIIWESDTPGVQFHVDGVQMAPGYVFGLAEIEPGKQIRVRAIAALDNRPAVSNWCTIIVAGPRPPPPNPAPTPPGPNPPPNPAPTPTPAPALAKNLWIVVVDDSLARTAAVTSILTDPFWRNLPTGRYKYTIEDINSPGVKEKYAGALKMNGGEPVIIIFDADARKWLNQNPDDLRLPLTLDGLRQLISKYNGGI